MKIIKSFLLCFCLLGVMTGCASEPMIQLSKENQAKIEKKRQAKEAKVTSETGKQSHQKQQTNMDPLSLVTIDTHAWKKADKASQWTEEEFKPILANEIRTFSNGKESKYLYASLMDENEGSIQIAEIHKDKQNIQFWQKNTGQWTQTAISQAKFAFLPINEMLTEADKALVMIQGPIQLGNTWDSGAGQAKITGLFDQAQFGDLSFEGVVEVQIGDNKNYYAKNIGLIAQLQNNQAWVIADREENVGLVAPIKMLVPDETGKTVLSQQVMDLQWQTNGNLANSLTQLFHELAWIGPEISVNQVTIEDDFVQIDFSPGVVATLNAHPAGEQAVLASIIANLSQWTGKEQVKLTVNNYIMTPSTLEYPPNGLYAFNPQWLDSYQEKPLLP